MHNYVVSKFLFVALALVDGTNRKQYPIYLPKIVFCSIKIILLHQNTQYLIAM